MAEAAVVVEAAVVLEAAAVAAAVSPEPIVASRRHTLAAVPASAVPETSRVDLRTVLVLEALTAALASLGTGPFRVLDAGGGTGGLAVPLAAAGHVVTVIDPSPDSLAALARRAAEAEVSDRITAVQGDLDDLAALAPTGSVDVVLCHGVLEVVDDRVSALAAVTGVLASGGLLSIVTANRLALVVHRSLTGRFADAQAALTRTARGPVDLDELMSLVSGSSLDVLATRGVRTVSDLVPGALVDGDPREMAALLALERAAADDPALRALATQLHVLCRRR